MRLAVIADPSFPALPMLRDAGISFFTTTDPAALRDAEAILLAPRYEFVIRRLDAPRLRWLHALAAGVETLPFDELRDRDVVITNSRGLYADALGEWVIAAILWFAKDLPRLARSKAEHKWDPFHVERLEGKSIGIIGFGGIGRAIARRAEAMRMNMITSRRSAADPRAFEADYVVLSVPLTDETHNLMSAARIAKMKPHAVLINVSRGAVVDEEALVDALRNRAIRGAALDVFQEEPLPPDHPLWSLDNVLLSPHSADWTADSHERAMRFFIENWRRYERGEALENVVDKNAGY
ncbi:MAG TPA: D-2-hydroxyacid dehydrogenase [Thermoanaerobaculia bacterium]|nr:D-2-hydroxyacid dehydrogenase [Thermoanaerobaculia bacterium]